MTRGLDCSQPISGAAVAAAGYVFVGRYLTSAYPATNPKMLRPAERDDLHAHGIAIILFDETNTDDLLGSASRAAAFASTGTSEAVGLGVPSGVAIFMCDDENNPMNRATVEADMTAAAGVIRPAGYLAGYYGSKDTARQLVAAHAVDVTFVVDTWGSNQPGDAWNFRQLPNSGQVVIGGVTCDIDDAPNPAGWWPAGPPPPLTPPLSYTTEVDVQLTKTLVTVQLDANGHGWDIMDGRDAAHPAIPFPQAYGCDANGSDPTGPGGYVELLPPTLNDKGGFTQVEAFGGANAAIGVWITHAS